MAIRLKIITPAMMLLTTSGCSWLFAPPLLNCRSLHFRISASNRARFFARILINFPPRGLTWQREFLLVAERVRTWPMIPRSTAQKSKRGRSSLPCHQIVVREGRERTIFASLTIMADNRLGLAKWCLFSGSNAFQPVS